jgi:aldose 1-epimerase
VANENNGANTLHGGPYGWGWRPWTVNKVTSDSVTMSFYDPAGLEGFPGAVTSQVVYTLRAGGVLDIDLYAQTSKRTPLLLSHHDYFNLDGFSVANSSVRDWMLAMPYASKAVETDSILIPTGAFRNVSGTPLDFLQARPIGDGWNSTIGLPGPGKLGFDTCWVNDGWAPATDPKLEVWSPASGIKMSVTTDQPAIQLYTCSGMDGTTPRKASQGGGFVDKDSCFVFEAEGVIDAINNPSWGIDQWFSPSRPYQFHASYAFSTI